MLKYIKDAMASAGIEIYPIISLLIFVLFFVILIVWTFKMKKEHIADLKNIPLNDGENHGFEDEKNEVFN